MCTFDIEDLWAEETNQGWAIIPEVDLSTETIGLKDRFLIRVGTLQKRWTGYDRLYGEATSVDGGRGYITVSLPRDYM